MPDGEELKSKSLLAYTLATRRLLLAMDAEAEGSGGVGVPSSGRAAFGDVEGVGVADHLQPCSATEASACIN